MGVAITRGFSFRPLGFFDLTASAATTPELNFEESAGGLIRIPTGSNITSLTFHAACWADPSKSGAGERQVIPAPTYSPLYDSTNTAVTRTVAANRAYALPPECFGAGGIKIVADAPGSVEISVKG
jgi:hypothetical protein